ncbi:hypothetical protein ACFX2I_028126 [Malus domestica]
MYAGRFSHEYSRCAEADDKTTLKAFTAGLRGCFFKYMINANTWKTYYEVMSHAYNHASVEARTYQEKTPRTIPYQQAINTVGQIRVKTGPTPRYEAYTPLNATCVAIYPSIAYLIPKPKPRQPDYKPTKNTGTFCCYHEHNGHDGEKCITLRDHIEALACEGKIDQFILHPQRGNRNQRQVNVIYSISGGTPISKSSNRAMKNNERALRSGHQVFHVEVIRGDKY